MFDLNKLKAMLLAIFSAVFGSGATVTGYEICKSTSEPVKTTCDKAE